MSCVLYAAPSTEKFAVSNFLNFGALKNLYEALKQFGIFLFSSAGGKGGLETISQGGRGSGAEQEEGRGGRKEIEERRERGGRSRVGRGGFGGRVGIGIEGAEMSRDLFFFV